MTNPIYDLEALALDLQTDGKHPKLVAAIRRCADVGSAHQDISQAIESLEALGVLTAGNREHGLPNDLTGTVAGSLMVSAIIFYARATDTDPIKGERRKWFGDGKLNADDRETHREVLNLRNKQVAHFGRSLAIDGELLIEETTVFRPHDPARPVGFLAARIHNKAAFAGRFAALAITVRQLAEEAAGQAFAGARAELSATLSGDPSLADRIRKFPVKDQRLLEIDLRPDGEWIDGREARQYRGTVVSRTVRSDIAAGPTTSSESLPRE